MCCPQQVGQLGLRRAVETPPLQLRRRPLQLPGPSPALAPLQWPQGLRSPRGKPRGRERAPLSPTTAAAVGKAVAAKVAALLRQLRALQQAPMQEPRTLWQSWLWERQREQRRGQAMLHRVAATTRVLPGARLGLALRQLELGPPEGPAKARRATESCAAAGFPKTRAVVPLQCRHVTSQRHSSQRSMACNSDQNM